MKETDSQAFRGVAWVGKAAQLCLALLAMLALVVVVAVLAPVMLTSAALPATMAWQKRHRSDRRHGRTTSEILAPRKAAASQASRDGEGQGRRGFGSIVKHANRRSER